MNRVDNLIGGTIRNLRESKGLQMRYVSAKSNVSLGFVSEIERGCKSPSGGVLESLIVNGLGMSLTEFYLHVARNAQQTL